MFLQNILGVSTNRMVGLWFFSEQGTQTLKGVEIIILKFRLSDISMNEKKRLPIERWFYKVVLKLEDSILKSKKKIDKIVLSITFIDPLQKYLYCDNDVVETWTSSIEIQ